MLIQGSGQAVEAFEQKVTDALEQGYSLAGELIAHSSASDIKFFQPVMFEEEYADEEEDEYEDEDED
jgi:hypothetical protein